MTEQSLAVQLTRKLTSLLTLEMGFGLLVRGRGYEGLKVRGVGSIRGGRPGSRVNRRQELGDNYTKTPLPLPLNTL